MLYFRLSLFIQFSFLILENIEESGAQLIDIVFQAEVDWFYQVRC